MSEEKKYKIFVGGLSQDTDDSSFKEYFLKFGEVTDGHVMKTQESGVLKSRGFGFVTFANKESYDDCLEAKDHQIDGKIVEVKVAVPRNATGPSSSAAPRKANVKKVFLGGLSKDTSEAEIREALEDICGKDTVADAKIMTDKNTNESRGFGFANLRDPRYTPEDHEYDEAAYAVVDKLVANKFIKIGEREVEVKAAKSVDEMKKEEESKAPSRPFYHPSSFGYGRDASMMYSAGRNPYAAMGSGYYGGSTYDYLQQQRGGRDYGMSAYASMYDRASYGYDSSGGMDYSKYYSQYSGMMPGSYQQSHSGYGPTRGYGDFKERTDRGSDSRSSYHPYRRY